MVSEGDLKRGLHSAEEDNTLTQMHFTYLHLLLD